MKNQRAGKVFQRGALSQYAIQDSGRWSRAKANYQVIGNDIEFNAAVTAGFRVTIRYWT